MAIFFFYGRDSVEFGPFSPNQMRALAAAEQIRPTDQVWQEGTQRKVPAGNVKNLFALPVPLQADPPAAVPSPPVSPTQEPAAEAAASPSPVPETTQPYRRDFSKKEAPRLLRVNRISGGILNSQDGTHVRFTKKCNVCNKEDSCRSTALIRSGCTRVAYYCRTCRKSRQVEIFGMS